MVLFTPLRDMPPAEEMLSKCPLQLSATTPVPNSSGSRVSFLQQTTWDLVQARKDEDRINVERYQPQPSV